VFSGSKENDLVIDFFAHAGTTLLASERIKRCCYAMDYDPVYCEIALRRLENYRLTGKTGWQNSNPFENEIQTDNNIKSYLLENYVVQTSKNAVAAPL
jgi:site-specific DNA-methyltransferase (adenine-specific)